MLINNKNLSMFIISNDKHGALISCLDLMYIAWNIGANQAFSGAIAAVS